MDSETERRLGDFLGGINNVTPELAQAMIPPILEIENDPRIFEMIEHLRHVYDPEIPTNVFELGLIYAISEDTGKPDHYTIRMTLTAPNCPVAGELPIWIADAAKKTKDVSDITVELVWDPPWNPTCMSETARLQLNMF
jgi:FeS assembly SUF system protein